MLLRIVLLFALSCSALAAGDANEVQYRITLLDPLQHRIHVQMNFPVESAGDLQMPVWNATYQVRDFAQYVSNVKAEGGAIQKVNPSRWRFQANASRMTVNYDTVADLPGPFGAMYDSDHAFLNFAMVLMYPVELRSAPVRVEIEAPANWHVATALPSVGGTSAGRSTFAVQAQSYDHLVDSPVELGQFSEFEFPLRQAKIRVAIHGTRADYDQQQITKSLQKITAAATDWMDEVPFLEYTFIFHFPHGPARGGMEHANSTAIDLNVDRLKSDYSAFESVSAHEFFHLWNVKRIRPRSMQPVDFTAVQPTTALWFSEGVTSTVGNYIQMRAGLEDEQRFLRHLGEAITTLESRPAHTWQSAEESSIDTWLDKYPAYELPERSISYYNKGEILGYMLDLRIRQLTGGKKSLRDVFHYLNEQYAHQGKFFPDSRGVEEAAEAIAGQSLRQFFEDYVAGVKEIPYAEFLHPLGLEITRVQAARVEAGFDAVRNFDGPLVVIRSDESNGAKVGDAILAINGKQPNNDLAAELSGFRGGESVVFRLRDPKGQERDLSVRLKERFEHSYQITELPQATQQQRLMRAQWLSGDSCTATSGSDCLAERVH